MGGWEDRLGKVLTAPYEPVLEALSMAKSKPTGILYREHEVKEDHSFTQGAGMKPGLHKRYSCKVAGRTVKGTLEEVKAKIDFHLNAGETDQKG